MPDTSIENILRILLVDDDVDFLTSMTGLLELENYPVEVACNSADALRKTVQFDPDVALVDIKLGSESGLDLVTKLRKINPELTCIIVTAYTDTDTAVEALKTGVYDYLRKPFEPNALFAVLHRCNERQKLIAEKKAADNAMMESEIRFRVAFETSPDAIILAHPGGNIIDVNHGFEEMIGHSRNQVIGRNSLEIGMWKNPADLTKLLGQLQKSHSVNNFEADFRLHDGQIRTGLVSARGVELGGEQVGLFVVRDIHDIKIKEKAIMESELRFRGLVSHLPGAVYRCLMDNDWTMEYISTPITDISGYQATDFVQNRVRSYASIIHSDDRDLVTQAVTRAVSQKEPFSIEYRILHVDGSVRWVYEKGQAIFNNDGDLHCLDGVIFDISENKKVIEALAETEDRFKAVYEEYNTVLEGIPDSIVLIDPQYKIVWGNYGAAKSFSIPYDELSGTACDKAWGEAGEQSLEGVKWVFESGLPVDTILKTADGRSWGVKTFPVKNPENRVVSVIQIASDLTEKIRLRDQASRSAHLAALGELAAGVAHEINNPVGTILVDMPMLQDAFNDLLPILEKHESELKDGKIAGLPFARFCQEAPLVINEIHDGAQRIKRIVEELKDFSKPASGELEKVDLNEVSQKAVSLVRNPIRKATDKFEESFSKEPLYCRGSAQRLEQVLVNLLLNACQALPDRGCGIRVETCFCEESDCVRMVVKDEGRGISQDIINQIADPFFTTRREVGGTGLGLSVSSRIIDEHRGTLTFESTPGHGTTVYVDLPVLDKVPKYE